MCVCVCVCVCVVTVFVQEAIETQKEDIAGFVFDLELSNM